MTPEFASTIGMDTIRVVLMVSAPVLLCGMAVGLVISVLQAVTQIQEMTLTFVPKIVAVFLALLFFLPWMIEAMLGFTTQILVNIPDYIR